MTSAKPTLLSRFEQIASENQAAAAIILAREPEGQSLEAQWARAISGRQDEPHGPPKSIISR